MMLKYISALCWYMAGFFIVPVLCLVTPKGSRQWKYLDRIYGNPIDPLEGDLSYQSHTTYFRRYRWCQLRNPINALLRRCGVNGTVSKITHRSHTTIAVIDGKTYKFLQYPLPFGFYWWWGVKLINDNRIDSRLEVGYHFENMLIVWPIKNKKITQGATQ